MTNLPYQIQMHKSRKLNQLSTKNEAQNPLHKYATSQGAHYWTKR